MKQHGREEPSGSDQMIDLVSAVEELSGLASRELNEMLKDSENFILQSKTENGGLKQVDMEKLASSLPLHLLAVCLGPGRVSDVAYVLRGMRLLHSLSELATRHARLEQILLDDVKISEQVMDLVFFVLSILSHRNQENHLGASPFLHSALVAVSLHLLTSYFSTQWHELVHVLLAHPKVDIFMDVAFGSLHEDVRILSTKLSALATAVLCNKSIDPMDTRTIHFICQQCEASLQFLLLLCQQKLFRDRVLKNKELSRNGGILSLSRTILRLGIPECLKGTTDVVASVSRLKAKILSILLQLCEAESVSYLDEVASSPKSMELGQSVALEVLDLLKTAFRREQKLPGDSHERSYPMGSVLINALRLVDIFSDDSNFRSSFITNTVPFLTQILAIPHEEFVSSWCSVNLPVIEEDANLDYDPFGAADLALVSVMSVLTDANYSCPFRSSGVPSIAYAQTRTSCMVKIIANLHVFVPNICEEQERDLFVQKFHKYLVSESSRQTVNHAPSDALKATTVCRNLGSLSEYSKSLIPNWLNEEDVQLLSDFAHKLQTWCQPQVGEDIIQVVKDEAASDSKENIQPMQHPLSKWTASLGSNMNNSPKDVQSMEGVKPSLSMKQEGNAREEAPRNGVTINGGTLQNSVGQDLVHLGVAKSPSTDYLGLASAITTGLQRCRMDLDPASSSGGHFKTPDSAKESGFQDDEKGENNPSDERQPKRRKRTIMNERQVNAIEKALIDEPDMHKNATLLQTWADKLSSQGSEITSSQLKNWLNNRKAKLARIAKEARIPSEGEAADKPSTPATPHFCDSPETESPGEESYVPPARVMSALGISKCGRLASGEGNEMVSQAEFAPGIPLSRPFTRSFSFEPGRLVSLIDNEGQEVGKGKIFQVEGRIQGKSLAESRICIVDVTELKIEKWREVPHPSEAAGRTFEEAAQRNGGVMRVAWDVIRVSPVVQ